MLHEVRFDTRRCVKTHWGRGLKVLPRPQTP